MASVYKPAGSRKYHIEFTDQDGRRRRKVGCADKGVSERMPRSWRRRLRFVRMG